MSRYQMMQNDATKGESVLDTLEYQHASLNHGRSSIRLVQVLPDLSTDGLIQCEISQHALPVTVTKHTNDGKEKDYCMKSASEEFHPYICLSYVWGDLKEKTTIRINGRTFRVGKNLSSFLRHARRTLSSTCFWIDALCIDQSNTKERNQQVQQMGKVYTLAQTVLIWLGDDLEIEDMLCLANEANGKLNIPLFYETLGRSTQLWYSRALLDFDRMRIMSQEQTPLPPGIASVDPNKSHTLNTLTGTLGKIEILFQKLTENEYWSRAWVTQEVLLAKHVVVAVGFEAHGLLSLARKFRTAIFYSRESLFDKLIDIWIQHKPLSYVDERGWLVRGGTGLEDWGIVNLLHRFRHKKSTVRRDRIYSLLALSDEVKTFKVDYDVPEEQIMRQILSIRKSSNCICSTAIVAHALAPWDFEPIKKDELEAPFADLHIYGCALSSAACSFCAHWVPFSWTRKRGLIFCLETTCPDTPGHIFWEQSDNIKNAGAVDDLCGQKPHLGMVYLQLRKNNNSRLLCKNGVGLSITQFQRLHMYKLRFTFRTLVEALLDDTGTSDLSLNACGKLWPNDSNQQTSSESRLEILW